MTILTPSGALFDEASALLDRLGLPMLFLDAGSLTMSGSYAQGWMRSRLLSADLRLTARSPRRSCCGSPAGCSPSAGHLPHLLAHRLVPSVG